MLVVLIGPGGVGKGTIANNLVARDPRIWLSRSWTTRPQRAHETGDEYVFVDRATFESAIASGLFLEWAEFHGNLYGTPIPQPSDGEDVLLEIEVQGAQQVKDVVPEAVIVLVEPPSMEVLEARLRGRGDDDEHVTKRLSSTPHELNVGRRLAAYVVVNDDIERATSEILSKLEERRAQRAR
jgi:guanylate kinase